MIGDTSDTPTPLAVPPTDLDAKAFESGSAPLTLTEFVDEPEWITAPPAKPGPGLPEACGWTIGVVVAHVLAGIVPLVLILVLMAVRGENPQTATEIEKLPGHYLMLLLGGDQWLFLLMTVVAVRLRWGRAYPSRLNLTPMRPLHAGLVLGLVLPLSTIAGEVYRQVNVIWKPLAERVPVLQLLDGSNAVELLMSTAHVGSLPIMLLIIAVAPAISEELVFRGMIGRGLVARWGLIGGVLISSTMFAAVHIHPVHVAAVLPIGIALHGVYLATRSFWAPVMLHLLNNAWATVMTRLLTERPEEALEEPVSAGLLIASVVAVVVLGILLYRTRTRYWLPDGREWHPGYVTAERPPAELHAVIAGGQGTARNLLLAGTAVAAFLIVLICEMTALEK